MRPMRSILLALSAAALAVAGPGARAQSTDGYHSVMVIPMVVDTLSFTQHFNFRNNNDIAIWIQPKYYPADGTTATKLTCPNIFINLGQHRDFNSLREICPGLPADTNSQFGYMALVAIVPTMSGPVPVPNTFTVYTRVSTPQGQGFSVEGFPMNTFTGADSEIQGLRQLAATGSSPSYQTNCFFANLAKLNPDLPNTSVTVHYGLYDNVMALKGSNDIVLAPGQFVRKFNIFADAGVVGNWDNILMRIQRVADSQPGIIAFCTVQDNTSLGADFRIAKQTIGGSPITSIPSHGAQDIFATRDVWLDHDALDRPFEIGPGAHANTHVLYYHSNDYFQCELIDPSTGVRALPAYGLELRTVEPDETPGAGGDNQVAIPASAFGYTNDKEENYANGRTLLEVESNESNTGANRPYVLHCRTGSGMTGFDILRYQEAIDRF